MATTVDAGAYYEEYHGHKLQHLEAVYSGLRDAGKQRFIYLAGDSSLDNKHWFFGSGRKAQALQRESDFVGRAVNGYERFLSPPHMVKDVCYWVNQECAARGAAGADICALNTAVEESCMVQREEEGLLPQDQFIRDHLQADDVLVIDVGGNDIALRPTKWVIANIVGLLSTPTWLIDWNLNPCMMYFTHMFNTRLRRYVEQLCEKKKPRKVVVCMLYFLDEHSGGSWADGVLSKLGYDSNPQKLQTVIRKVYEYGVKQIRIPGVEVVPLPLFEVLDGKNTEDYVQRVEPSVTGGQKLATAIADKIFAA